MVLVEQPLALPGSANYTCKQACCVGFRADPYLCNSTSRQNPPIQKSRCNFLTNTVIYMPFKI